VDFLDPILTSDGRPYGPHRFKEIAKERYLISKHCHTSYKDLDNVTPLEREYLLEFIYEELQKEQQAYEEAKRNSK
jgi:hypothetical protein